MIFYTDLDVLFFNNIELNLDIRDKSNLYANLDVLTFDEQFTLGVGKSGYKEEQLKIIKDEIINPRSRPNTMERITTRLLFLFLQIFLHPIFINVIRFILS